ncbi:MAG: hypothetical protein AB7O28_25955 [Vicinamibacterales bacterium]
MHGTAGDTNTIRIGFPYNGGAGQNRTFIAGIHRAALTGPAVPVFVDANGQLGTVTAPVVTGGGTLAPSVHPRDFEALVALVRAQQATIAEQAAALDAMRQRLDAMDRRARGR